MSVIGVSLPLVLNGVRHISLIAVGLLAVGVALFLWGVVTVPAIPRIDLTSRHTESDVARWLHRCADWGTHHIQNDINIKSERDVVGTLRPRYADWNQIIREATVQHCREIDVADIERLGAFTPRGFSGVNSEHQEIKERVAELVVRIRKLAARLEQGETRLK
jgi:hypothetical protein